jgi:hypothetical protein
MYPTPEGNDICLITPAIRIFRISVVWNFELMTLHAIDVLRMLFILEFLLSFEPRSHNRAIRATIAATFAASAEIGRLPDKRLSRLLAVAHDFDEKMFLDRIDA